ncbi:DNA-binding domain-containing protein [Chitinophaga sp. 212800010-3]|uniref:HvfC/BufC N-terminal domain-containing protein n=1 Tax=unclassified Chitinophaga TaxID=2619133 RepID=UPI002DF19E7F|nr:DUF2063 domain-containing protein [Chitinophaga sp. 212800010-3]
MSLLPDTRQIQQTFSAYCRTGKPVKLPGLTPGRIQHYRQLVFNVICDTMESAFPITFSSIPAGKWNRMVKEFFARHACKSYQVWKLPLEFYTYAVENNWEEVHAIPYLNDLLAFEWAEMEVYNMEDIMPAPYQMSGSWTDDPLVLNPEHRLLQFAYPVHLTSEKKALLSRKGTYFVLLHRHPDTGNVEFTDLSPWLALVTEQMVHGLTLKDILEYAPQLNITVTDILEKDTLAFLQHMQQQQFVLGFQR